MIDTVFVLQPEGSGLKTQDFVSLAISIVAVGISIWNAYMLHKAKSQTYQSELYKQQLEGYKKLLFAINLILNIIREYEALRFDKDNFSSLEEYKKSIEDFKTKYFELRMILYSNSHILPERVIFITFKFITNMYLIPRYFENKSNMDDIDDHITLIESIYENILDAIRRYANVNPFSHSIKNIVKQENDENY